MYLFVSKYVYRANVNLYMFQSGRERKVFLIQRLLSLSRKHELKSNWQDEITGKDRHTNKAVLFLRSVSHKSYFCSCTVWLFFFFHFQCLSFVSSGQGHLYCHLHSPFVMTSPQLSLGTSLPIKTIHYNYCHQMTVWAALWGTTLSEP